jgi:fucose permease
MEPPTRDNASHETSHLLGPEGLQSSDGSSPGPTAVEHDAAAAAAAAPPPRVQRLCQIAATMFSFATLGMFVSSIGVLLPHLERWYDLDDTQVSLVFVVGPVGYVCAARLNHLVHVRLGRRGIALAGPALQLTAAVMAALHPRFSVLLVSAAVGAFGGGLLDGSWCAWAAGTPNANLISGLLHGSFSVGAGVGPVLISALLSGGHRYWYHWYFLMVRKSPVLEEAISPHLHLFP